MTNNTELATYVISALPERVLSDARGRLVERSQGDGDVVELEAEGGEPLRCCLRDADVGEQLMLFNYRPPLPARSPYQETGAVFAHAHAGDCRGAEPTHAYPEAWRGRRQVLRAYDERGFIHPATRVHDGTDPEGVISEILVHPDVVLVHSRNIAYGCYMFAIERR
jgi:hypothetical protein